MAERPVVLPPHNGEPTMLRYLKDNPIAFDGPVGGLTFLGLVCWFGLLYLLLYLLPISATMPP
jgi:hypothetical protein